MSLYAFWEFLILFKRELLGIVSPEPSVYYVTEIRELTCQVLADVRM